jgi:hypothetical protein
MQHAAMYLTQSEWVLTSMSRTRAGVWVANFVIHRLAAACPDEELGAALCESLGASQTEVEHPASWPLYHREFREKLGVLSFERFISRSRMLAVHSVAETVVLTPHRNRGHRHGYEPLAAKLTVQAADAQALGQAVRQCADRCE